MSVLLIMLCIRREPSNIFFLFFLAETEEISVILRLSGNVQGRAAAMAKSKYDTHVLPNLEKVEAWAREGATAKEIAGKLKIAYSSLKKYLDLGRRGDERYRDFADCFARACEVADEQVEAALYKRACGFEYTETKREQKVDRNGNIVELVTTTNKVVPPDPTSAMFWLTNRRPDRWSYKPQPGDDDGDEGSGVVILTPVMDNPGPPEEGGAPHG